MRAIDTPPAESEPDVQADDEQAWIASARRDPRAFAPLYERYATPVYRYCLRQTGDAEVANDLTAQVFVRVLENLDRYRPRPGATFRSWLFTIARNIVADNWRRFRPVRTLEDHEAHLPDHDPGPDAIAVHRTEMDALLAILGELPEVQQAIVQLRLAGLTTLEIADVIGMSVPAVKSAQTRAYATIRALMSPRKGGLA